MMEGGISPKPLSKSS